ncbi:MAG: hypothetical protein M0Z77_01325 [Thermoplasmatales archaeon]|nr:hypothetical protein [Candidatus Thermoplasmatota archaeon]MDA8054277.1 hypothetical protein [Thermoplasmatales archaeon]
MKQIVYATNFSAGTRVVSPETNLGKIRKYLDGIKNSLSEVMCGGRF